MLPKPIGSGAKASCHSSLVALLLAALPTIAATIGPSGYTNAFAIQPPAADWATLSIGGVGQDTYNPDTQVNATTANSVMAPTASDGGNPPAASLSGVWSSTGLYLQTRPTGNRASLLMAKFVNQTGTNASQIVLSYLFTIAAGGSLEDNGKGTRVYFSVTGEANSWTNVSSLNTTSATTGSFLRSASIDLNWTNNGSLFVAWLDDNGSAGTDPANQYDNFSLRVTAGTPTNFFCHVAHPGPGATLPSGFALTTAALTDHGTAPYRVEYFTNGGAANTIFASAGTSITPPYQVSLGNLSAGMYRIYAVSTDSAAVPLFASSHTNTFAVADPLLVALTAPLNGSTFAHTNPVIGAVTVSGGTAPYSVQFYLNDAPSGSAVSSVPFERNFGPLPVGEYTIRAIVTDANGWVNSSSVSPVHIDGPLAVSLAPPNNSVFLQGTSVSLNAQVAGGSAPYVATFYTNGQPSGSLGSPPFTVGLGMLPVGSYTCYVHATDSSVPAQTARSTTNRFTIVPPPLRVMPLGDSITLGIAVAGGYRAPLFQLFTNAGRNVDFIGTQTGNGSPALPDPEHEGYSGFTIRGIDSLLPGIFGGVAPPDIILLLLGVNDYRVGDDIIHATNRLEDLIVRLATNWPAARIIVGSLTPVSEPTHSQIQTTFNPLLPGLCERQRGLGRQVYFTDMHEAVPLADMPDQLHPNQLGYNKMATNWFSAVNLLPCAGCPPRFTLQPKSQSMLPGTNVSLSVGAVGAGGPIQFQWRLDGQDIPGATNNTYGFTNASISHQGHYTVIATDNNGAAISSNAFVFLFIRPVVVQNPLPQTILQGSTARFTAIATGAPPIWYRWLSNAVGILTNDTGVLVLTNVQSSHNIRVTATNLASGPFGVAGINVPLTVLADADRDGMADRWETIYPGFSTNNAGDALLDFDGDGLNNREEYITATDPTNPGSVLRITIGLTNSSVLQFVAQSNIAYSVEYRTNLNSATWNNLTNINGQLQTRVVPIAVPDPRTGEHYYRVVTPPSP